MNPFESLPIKSFATPASGLIDKAVAGDAPGRIHYNGTTWFARSHPSYSDLTFTEGEWVLILARQGNTLLIGPIEAKRSSPHTL